MIQRRWILAITSACAVTGCSGLNAPTANTPQVDIISAVTGCGPTDLPQITAELTADAAAEVYAEIVTLAEPTVLTQRAELQLTVGNQTVQLAGPEKADASPPGPRRLRIRTGNGLILAAGPITSADTTQGCG